LKIKNSGKEFLILKRKGKTFLKTRRSFQNEFRTFYLGTRLNTLERSNQELSQQNQELRDTNDTLRKENENLQMKITNLEKEVADLKRSISDLQQDRKEMEDLTLYYDYQFHDLLIKDVQIILQKSPVIDKKGKNIVFASYNQLKSYASVYQGLQNHLNTAILARGVDLDEYKELSDFAKDRLKRAHPGFDLKNPPDISTLHLNLKKYSIPLDKVIKAVMDEFSI